MAPDDVLNAVNLGLSYQFLNRFTDADAVYREAAKDPQAADYLIEPRYALAFFNDDKVEMARQVEAAADKPGIEDRLLAEDANSAAWYGKMKRARELSYRAMDLAQRTDAKEAAAMYQAMLALGEVEVGQTGQGHSDARDAAKLAPSRDAKTMAALALVRAGDITAAQQLMDELDKRFPLDTIVQRYRLPTVRAAIALQRNDPNLALELLKATGALELGASGNLLPAYVRGQAYLAMRDGQAAAVEFQKFNQHRGLVGNFILGALARLGLARALALEASSDQVAHDRSRAAYQDFLALWKDADPDIPIYNQARADIEGLSSGRRRLRHRLDDQALA